MSRTTYTRLKDLQKKTTELLKDKEKEEPNTSLKRPHLTTFVQLAGNEIVSNPRVNRTLEVIFFRSTSNQKRKREKAWWKR